jgi:hypothetical protein
VDPDGARSAPKGPDGTRGAPKGPDGALRAPPYIPDFGVGTAFTKRSMI